LGKKLCHISISKLILSTLYFYKTMLLQIELRDSAVVQDETTIYTIVGTETEPRTYHLFLIK
jgi:hypothetical protein